MSEIWIVEIWTNSSFVRREVYADRYSRDASKKKAAEYQQNGYRVYHWQM